MLHFQDLKFNSRFVAEYFEIEATDFYLEPDATLNCVGRGSTTKGLGSGVDSPSGGSGAGQATVGGSGKTAAGGGVYNSLYAPTMTGAQGGAGPHGAGSRGGGRIKIRVGYAFILDGFLKADAANANANTGLSRFLYL